MERRTFNNFLNVAAAIATVAAIPFWFGTSPVFSWIAAALALSLVAARFLPTSKMSLPVNLLGALAVVLVSTACVPYILDQTKKQSDIGPDKLAIKELSVAKNSLSQELATTKENLKTKLDELAKLKSRQEGERKQHATLASELEGKNKNLVSELSGEQGKLSNLQRELEKLKKTLKLNSAPELVSVAGDEVVAIEIVEFTGDGLIEAWLDKETNKIMNTPITGKVDQIWSPSSQVMTWLRDKGRNQTEHTLPTIKREVDSAVAKLASSGWSSASIEPVSFSREFSSGKHVLHFRITPSKAGTDWKARVNITKSKNKEKQVVTTLSLPDSQSGASEAQFEFFVPASLDD